MQQIGLYTTAVGSNGLGVYTDYDKLTADLPYMGQADYEDFSDLGEAMRYAIRTYNNFMVLLNREARKCPLKKLRLDWFYFGKDFLR